MKLSNNSTKEIKKLIKSILVIRVNFRRFDLLFWFSVFVFSFNTATANTELLNKGDFDRNKYGNIEFRTSVLSRIGTHSCSLLKLSPNARQILLSCRDQQRKSSGVVILDIDRDTYRFYGSIPSYLVDWFSNDSLIFLGPDKENSDILVSTILDLETLMESPLTVVSSLSERYINWSRIESADFRNGFFYIVEDEGFQQEPNKYAIETSPPFSIVSLDSLQEPECLANFCYGEMSFAYNAHSKKIQIYPTFTEPFRNRIEISRYWHNPALAGVDVSNNTVAEKTNGIVYVWDFSEKFQSQGIDGWDSLNVIKGTRSGKKDISGTGLIEAVGSDLTISLFIVDDELIVADSGSKVQDSIDIWLHTQEQGENRRVNGPGTFHFRLNVGDEKLIFEGKGHYAADSEIPEVEKAIAKTTITDSGYHVVINIPEAVYKPFSKQLYYQVNVLDVDSEDDAPSVILSTNRNLRKYFEADVSVFNQSQLPW